MRKWTKGFLIFGVVTTIIGFILLFVGIQSDGIKSLLAMSKEPVYDSRMEELTFGKEVEKPRDHSPPTRADHHRLFRWSNPHFLSSIYFC